MGQSQTIPFGRNGRSRKGCLPGDDADARYAAALKLVQTIDRDLQKGTRHYYDSRGQLLSTLDEVIHAMLTDNLAFGKPAGYTQKEAVPWSPVGELAA
jgi:hypothetical protein